MGYPPPPPPPGTPGGYGPPPGPPPGGPGYGPPPGSPPPPPGGPGYGGPPTGGYGGPPPGYGGPPPGPAPAPGSGSSKGPLVALMAALVVVVLLVVVAAVVLVSAGGDDDVELTEAQLQDALLTEGDVGDGFTVDPATDDSEDEFDRDEVDASEECLDLYEQFATASETDDGIEAKAKFDGADGAQVEQTLGQGSSFGLDEVRQFADTCDEIAIDDGENVGSLTFEIVDDVTEVGDDSLTLRIVVDLDEPVSLTLPSLGVLWERDGVESQVSVTGAIDETTFEASEPDEDLLVDVVARADERLAEVIDEA